MPTDSILDKRDILKVVMETAAGAIILINDKGKVYFWNHAAERIFEYKASEVIGKDLHLLVTPPGYHNAYLAAFEKFSPSGQGSHVYHNETFEKRFGMTRDQWYGKTDFEMWPREIAEKLRVYRILCQLTES